MNPLLDINQEVTDALKNQQPIVALESTIISHGMPYPDNLTMAKQVEEIIREQGAVPATIAVIKGVVKVGLSEEDIIYLAQEKDVLKLSKRDLAYAISQKKTGATTVSATMLIAEMAGIKVFATGGIGGVHRNAQETFDISRDLEELACVKVAVVCAGVKSILDLPLTLEYLETKGVEVIGYQTDFLPAFYAPSSPYKLEIRLDDAASIASLMAVKWEMGINGGMVIANPVPNDKGMALDTIDKLINQALLEAHEEGIIGKAVTPFLLNRVKQLTKGESLEANIALVLNNALLASGIAKAYAAIKKSSN